MPHLKMKQEIFFKRVLERDLENVYESIDLKIKGYKKRRQCRKILKIYRHLNKPTKTQRNILNVLKSCWIKSMIKKGQKRI